MFGPKFWILSTIISEIINEGNDTMADTKELRGMIEDIDHQIIELIATRMEIADELAKAKKSSSQGYWDTSKEKEVISRYMDLCKEVGLTQDEAYHIADAILKISKDRQHHYFI